MISLLKNQEEGSQNRGSVDGNGRERIIDTRGKTTNKKETRADVQSCEKRE